MTITNSPAASSQIELGRSHYLIRSLWIRRLLCGELAFGLNYASIYTDVLLHGHTPSMWPCVRSSWTHSLISIKCLGRRSTCCSAALPHASTCYLPHQTSRTSKRAKRHPPPPPLQKQRHRGCACLSVCVPGFPRVHQQLCWADGPLWYGGVILWGPLWNRCHCDQLCLPPAIGQGSYNRRFGARGPSRTEPRLSRCGEGVGRDGLSSPTVEAA